MLKDTIGAHVYTLEETPGGWSICENGVAIAGGMEFEAAQEYLEGIRAGAESVRAASGEQSRWPAVEVIKDKNARCAKLLLEFEAAEIALRDNDKVLLAIDRGLPLEIRVSIPGGVKTVRLHIPKMELYRQEVRNVVARISASLQNELGHRYRALCNVSNEPVGVAQADEVPPDAA